MNKYQSQSFSNRSNMSSSCPMKNDSLNSFPVAMAYVPWQYWTQTYDLDKALSIGTLFPELNKPFLRGGCYR